METAYFLASFYLLDVRSFRITCDRAVIQREMAIRARGKNWVCGGNGVIIAISFYWHVYTRTWRCLFRTWGHNNEITGRYSCCSCELKNASVLFNYITNTTILRFSMKNNSTNSGKSYLPTFHWWDTDRVENAPNNSLIVACVFVVAVWFLPYTPSFMKIASGIWKLREGTDSMVTAYVLNLGCLYPVACERSGDGFFFIRLRNVAIVG
jgi:hypothetical protein